MIGRPCQRCGARTKGTTYCERCQATGPSRLPRPCVECGAPVDDGDYCAEHEPKANRPHYQGSYRRDAEKLVDAANKAGARALCSICGHGPRADDPWTAHHVDAGNPASPLRVAHASCNYALGDRTG